ncbi:MAG: hypothetical protein DRP08_05380 [Candidatus Aenigmatarchaeota archaeon]|nr:MAG: hypothetical protein DRP08_05380 [Candidatus Aenigmarchaeota archaeon]
MLRRDWVSTLIQADIIKRGMNKVEVQERPRTTVIYSRKDLTLDKNYAFVDIEGCGKVHEILLMTDSKEYTLYVLVDEKEIYNDTYSHLSEMSRFLNEVGTRTSGMYHILSIVDIPFMSSLYIRVDPSESILFKEVLIKYEVNSND